MDDYADGCPMSARSDDYLRRVVIAVGVAAAAVLIVLAVWAASRMLLLVFGGILLAGAIFPLALTRSA